MFKSFIVSTLCLCVFLPWCLDSFGFNENLLMKTVKILDSEHVSVLCEDNLGNCV